MPTMYVALRKAKLGDGDVIDNLITVFSGFGKYCHAELVFSDGLSFSSTMTFTGNERLRDANGASKPDGTRWAKIDYEAEKDRWDLIPIEVDAKEEQVMREFAYSELDARYDRLGCLRFAIPFVRQSEDKWFCSEVVAACLLRAGVYPSGGRDGWPPPHKISPNDLGKLLGVKS